MQKLCAVCKTSFNTRLHSSLKFSGKCSRDHCRSLKIFRYTKLNFLAIHPVSACHTTDHASENDRGSKLVDWLEAL